MLSKLAYNRAHATSGSQFHGAGAFRCPPRQMQLFPHHLVRHGCFAWASFHPRSHILIAIEQEPPRQLRRGNQPAGGSSHGLSSFYRNQKCGCSSRICSSLMTNFAKRIVPVVLLLATVAFAADPVALKPPAGAKVAIVEFVDLECPMCAHAAPIVKEASDKYSIPLIRHDFPLPMHAWSRRAAVIARYFDTKSVPVANDFRDYIFAHQREVEPGTL